MAKKLNKKTSELIISVVADKAQWQDEQAKAQKVLAENLTMKGFRKGKVPADIAKKSISQEEVFQKAIKKTLDVLVQKAADEIKDEFILDGPTYNVKKISNTELEVDFIYPLYPEIKMSDYKKLGIKLDEVKSDAKAIDAEIEKLQAQHALLIDKDVVAKGSVVNFDFEGFVEGKAFEGGKAEKFDLEIGSGQFIPGFEDKMVGLKKGDKKDIEVTFPKEYQSPDLQGKKATFKIVIHSVKEKELPKLDDNFVKEMGIPKAKTVEALKSYIKDNLELQGVQQARAAFQRKAFDKIKKDTEIILPSQLVYKEMATIAKQFEDGLKQQGLEKAQYMEMAGLNQVALESQFKSQAEDRLKDSLIFAEIAKLEKITLEEKDYNAEYVKLAKVYGQKEDAIKQTVTKQQMQIPMTNDRVIDALVNFNK